MFATFLKNDVLANLAFLLVIVIGCLSYIAMPRQQDPEINFFNSDLLSSFSSGMGSLIN